MSEPHGSATITSWLEDLVEFARSREDFEVSAGAEPDRQYAYLEYHGPDDRHSILLFLIEHADGRPEIKTHRFDGASEAVREKVYALTHGD